MPADEKAIIEIRRLYVAYAARLFRSVLMPVLKDRAAAQDALRETFLAAMDGVGRVTGDGVLPWLATIARNKALDSLRATKARVRLGERAAGDPPPPGPDQPEQIVAELEQREQARAKIEAVLSELNERYAQALRLRLLEDRERQECADRLGTSLGAFDVLFFRACKAFKAAYVQRFGVAP